MRKLKYHIRRKIGNIRIYKCPGNFLMFGGETFLRAVHKKEGYYIADALSELELYFAIIREIKEGNCISVKKRFKVKTFKK